MNQGEWALTMSALSLCVSGALGIWQVARYFLEGGRVVVTLEVGQLRSHMFSKQTISSMGLRNPFRPEVGDDFIEVLYVTVANRGRTAVTISESGLDLGSTRPYRGRPRKRARNRQRVTPGAYAFEGERAKTPVRLEPFDSCLFIYDAEPALSAELLNAQETRVLRGYAVVAGTAKATLSKESLRIPDGQKHLSDEKPSLRRILFVALDRDRRAREEREDEVDFSPEYLSFKVSQAVDEGTPLPQALKDAAAVDDNELGSAMALISARMALRKHGYEIDID